jgi:hypothetical protein
MAPCIILRPGTAAPAQDLNALIRPVKVPAARA